MSSSLVGNRSSKKQQAFSELFPSKAYIKVYVESPADVGFWYSIFYHEQQKILKKLRFYPYSSEKSTTGKSGLIKLVENTKLVDLNENNSLVHLIDNTGEFLLICLDSDYDWLLNTDINQKIQAKKPYVFQTYSYSPENLLCYAESLNKLIVKAVNNTDNFIDLAEFLRDYSCMVYPLLLWHLYFKSIGQEKEFTMDDFTKIVTIKKEEIKKIPLIDSKNTLLIEIQKKVNQKTKEIFKLNFKNFEVFITENNESFQKKGLTKETAYLFMQGHALYNFIRDFLIEICEYLKIYFQDQIIIPKILENISDEDFQSKLGTSKEDFNKLTFANKKKTLNEANLGKEFGEYCKLISIAAILAQNEDFKDCFLFREITTDIENYLATFKQNTQGLNHV